MPSQGGWIGFDLDGTLAHYEGWNEGRIGAPIPGMAATAKRFLEAGVEVRIVTARVAVPEGMGASERLVREEVVRRERAAIREWTEKHLGKALRATAQKDYAMICLYDDRCVCVETNTGRCKSWEEEL